MVIVCGLRDDSSLESLESPLWKCNTDFLVQGRSLKRKIAIRTSEDYFRGHYSPQVVWLRIKLVGVSPLLSFSQPCRCLNHIVETLEFPFITHMPPQGGNMDGSRILTQGLKRLSGHFNLTLLSSSLFSLNTGQILPPTVLCP